MDEYLEKITKLINDAKDDLSEEEFNDLVSAIQDHIEYYC